MMERQNIYWRDEFAVEIGLTAERDGKTVPADIPPFDWGARIFTPDSTRHVTISQKDGVAHGWSRTDDGKILVHLDRHGLMPGPLIAEFSFLLPDGGYADGNQRLNRRYDLGVDLTTDDRDVPTAAEANPVEIPWQYMHDTDVYARVLELVNEELRRALYGELPGGVAAANLFVPEARILVDSHLMTCNARPEYAYAVKLRQPSRRNGNGIGWSYFYEVMKFKTGVRYDLSRLFPGGRLGEHPIKIVNLPRGSNKISYDPATGILYAEYDPGSLPGVVAAVDALYFRQRHVAIGRDGSVVPVGGGRGALLTRHQEMPSQPVHVSFSCYSNGRPERVSINGRTFFYLDYDRVSRREYKMPYEIEWLRTRSRSRWLENDEEKLHGHERDRESPRVRRWSKHMKRRPLGVFRVRVRQRPWCPPGQWVYFSVGRSKADCDVRAKRIKKT